VKWVRFDYLTTMFDFKNSVLNLPFLISVLIACALMTGCSKEEASVNYFDAAKSYDVVTPEPLIQGFVQLLTNDEIESIYMPEYAFRALDIAENKRQDYLKSTNLVLLYSPEHHESFEEFFVIKNDNSWNNITYLRDEEIGADYPFISPDELQKDLDQIASILETEFPQSQDIIAQNKAEVEERIVALDEYTKEALALAEISDVNFIVESNYMKQWLENYLPQKDSVEIVVVEELLSGESFDVSRYLEDDKENLLIATSIYPKQYIEKDKEISNLTLVQFNVFKDGYNGPDSYFENMLQNIKILTLSSYSSD